MYWMILLLEAYRNPIYLLSGMLQAITANCVFVYGFNLRKIEFLIHNSVFVQCCVWVICEVVIILFQSQLAALYGNSNISYLVENIKFLNLSMPSACISTCFFFSNLLLCVNLVIPGPKLRPCSANSVTSLLHSMTNFSRSQVAHHMTHTRRNIWFQAYSSNMTPRKRSKCPLILPLSVSVHFSDLCNYTERVIFGFSVQIEYIKIVIMKGRCIL